MLSNLRFVLRKYTGLPGAFVMAILGFSLGSRVSADDVPKSDITVMDKVIVEATRPEARSGPFGFLFHLN